PLPARRWRSGMKAVAKAGAVVITALALLVGAAALIPRGSDATDPGDGALAAAPSDSALLRPAVAAGSLEASIAALQERLRQAPDDWRGFATLGLAYVAQARVSADPSWYPKAEGALRESVRLHGEDNVDALLGLGALALARHDFEAALELGSEAEALNPYDADVYGVIGDAQLELGRYDDAFVTFQTMVDTRPGLASYARVSYARELLGDVAGAIDGMRRAFDSAGSPADAAWAAQQLGELEFGRGAVASARAWFDRGLELDPRFVPNLAGLAKVAWATGDVELAIRRYREVVAAYPSVEYAAALGDLYAASGRDDLAREQFAVVEATRALAESNGVNVDLEIALFDADHGSPVSALDAAEAEWARRRSVHVADAYAWALAANGRYDEAARIMNRALALGTRTATFLFHAGMIERARGRDEAARGLLLEALATNPHFSIVHAPIAERVLAELAAGR
ncbi:MAG: tetratricopeptide repeat protein, partial [Actinomycetota bacterium]